MSDSGSTGTDLWAWLAGRRTIRRFQETPVPLSDLERLVQFAQRAPTACSFQTYSFVALTDPARRQTLMNLLADVGSYSMPEAPVWIIACVDLDRYFRLLEAAGVDEATAQQTSPTRVLLGVHDVGLAVSNLVTAAEGMGYGTMLHASVIYRPREVAQFLGLPTGVMALETIMLGVPAEDPPLRPRWPVKNVLHLDHYHPVTREQAHAYLLAATEMLDIEGYYNRYTHDQHHGEHIVNKTRRSEGADERDHRVREYLEDNYLSL